MSDANPSRDGDYVSFRLYPKERYLIQHLGRGNPEVTDRYTALEALAEIVPSLDLEDVRTLERRAIRIRMPPATEAAIRKKADETGQTFLAVLLAAAAEYRRRFPVTFEPPDES